MACERPQPWERMNKTSLNSSPFTFFSFGQAASSTYRSETTALAPGAPFLSPDRSTLQMEMAVSFPSDSAESLFNSVDICPEGVRHCRNGFYFNQQDCKTRDWFLCFPVRFLAQQERSVKDNYSKRLLGLGREEIKSGFYLLWVFLAV